MATDKKFKIVLSVHQTDIYQKEVYVHSEINEANKHMIILAQNAKLEYVEKFVLGIWIL